MTGADNSYDDFRSVFELAEQVGSFRTSIGDIKQRKLANAGELKQMKRLAKELEAAHLLLAAQSLLKCMIGEQRLADTFTHHAYFFPVQPLRDLHSTLPFFLRSSLRDDRNCECDT